MRNAPTYWGIAFLGAPSIGFGLTLARWFEIKGVVVVVEAGQDASEEPRYSRF